MSNAEKQSRTLSSDGPGTAAASAELVPGKRTLVEQLAQVQARGRAGEDHDAVHAAAARGVATPASPLPHQDAIQRAFGRHDISSVQAHVGPDAARSARDMGADAYATGDHVVLGAGSDLSTVAHEAAHVVQQRGGVQLKGGVGAEGDPYERHADEVASLVVHGQSAEAALDRYAGGGTAAPSGGVTQRKLTVGQTSETDVETVWARIASNPLLKGIETQARALLTQWIANEASYDDASQVSEKRTYPTDEQLVRALAGDVKASANLTHEGNLAQQTMDEGQVNALLGTFLAKLQQFQGDNKSSLPTGAAKSGRYGDWAYPKAPMATALAAAPGDLQGRIAIIADYALAVRGDIKKLQGGWDFRMTAELEESRSTHWNTDEDAPWVQEARQHQSPLSAGPSATTAQVLALAVAIGATLEEKTALAWALFALWNGMPLHKAGTHRFHEVMAVAVQYGVPYERFQYSNPPGQA